MRDHYIPMLIFRQQDPVRFETINLSTASLMAVVAAFLSLSFTKLNQRALNQTHLFQVIMNKK